MKRRHGPATIVKPGEKKPVKTSNIYKVTMGKKEGKKKEEERRRGKKERKAGMHRATNPRKSFVATGKKEMASILRNIRKRIKKKKTLPRKKPVTFYFFFFFFQDKDLESRDLQKYHKKKKERSTTKTYATKLNYISLKLTKQKCRNISKKKTINNPFTPPPRGRKKFHPSLFPQSPPIPPQLFSFKQGISTAPTSTKSRGDWSRRFHRLATHPSLHLHPGIQVHPQCDCSHSARTDATGGVHNNHCYVRNVHRSNTLWDAGEGMGCKRVERSCIYLWKIPRVTGPDAAIRRNRASLQRQRVSRMGEGGSWIYIRNFRGLTANMPRLPPRFCIPWRGGEASGGGEKRRKGRYMYN